MSSMILIGLIFVIYSIFSKYLENTSLTAPIIFSVLGFLLSSSALGWVVVEIPESSIHILAEVTLVLVLFADAANVDCRALIKNLRWPLRMLIIAMPITILVGFAITIYLFSSLSVWEAALVAAILTPTDAALGQAVVTSREIPTNVKQSLNVESGLNDGIALPLVFLFASLANVAPDIHGEDINWFSFTLKQIGIGFIVGGAVGYIGARMVNWAVSQNLMSQSFEAIGALAIVLLAFASAEVFHGNGFIAAFISGLIFGNFLSRPCLFLREFTESEGKLFTLAMFLIFGLVLFPTVVENFELSWLWYSVLSLTVVRMLPIAISLLGTQLDMRTVLFFGWFGPRGLASILFFLLVSESGEFDHLQQIQGIVFTTVAMSILLHGITAVPLSRWYGKRSRREIMPFQKFSGESNEKN